MGLPILLIKPATFFLHHCSSTRPIWGSAYAVEVGLASEDQTRRISTYLVEHYDETVLNGQIRHLTRSEEAWNSLFKPCEEGTYQNGAYWATPLAWVIPVYARYNPGLAKEMASTSASTMDI